MPRPQLSQPSADILRRAAALTPPQRGAWAFTLRSITPVLGGGVRPWEPDRVDVVRAPGIRGQLRWWWRLLYAEDGEDPEALFRREAELWGGVDVPCAKAGEPARAVRSRVALRVVVTAQGKVEPAGQHERNNHQNLRPAASWPGVRAELSYALFPLQRPKEELQAAQGAAGNLPTRDLREGLEFTLHVQTDGLRAEEADQVLGAVWMWAHFGGLGARTRRGFGALRVKSAVVPDLWRPMYAGISSANDFIARLQSLSTLGCIPARSRLWRCRLLYGKPGQVGRAHGQLVGALRDLRQGKALGRDPGGARPGPSRWPEPHLLRIKAEGQGRPLRWAHSPDVVRGVSAKLRVPRAAFGLPILVQFKDDPPPASQDSPANATIKPVGPDGQTRERWASPLHLRPVGLTTPEMALPVALVLPERPERLRIEFRGHAADAAVSGDGTGARGDILSLLQSARGDAILAYASLLKDEGFALLAWPTAPAGGAR